MGETASRATAKNCGGTEQNGCQGMRREPHRDKEKTNDKRRKKRERILDKAKALPSNISYFQTLCNFIFKQQN